jgi:uncharacterized protein with HEPN domain
MTPLEIQARLWHVEQSCAKLMRFTKGKTFAEYAGDEVLISAVERELITIGEALNRTVQLAPELATRISSVRQIVAMRNQMMHNYPQIESETVWLVVQRDIPRLLDEVRDLLAQ